MKKSFIILISLFSFFCANQKACAQLEKLTGGERIRITAIDYFFHPTIAVFEKIYFDSLFCTINNKKMGIPIPFIQKLEISQKKKRNTITGMIAGSLVGSVVLGVAMYSEKQNSQGFGSIGQPGFWGGFASGAILGGGLGALIGSQVQSERWEQISIKEK